MKLQDKVVVSDMNPEGAQATVADIEANGGKAIAVAANVAKEEDVQNMIDTAVNTYGTLDVLVNNAGIMDNMVPGQVQLTPPRSMLWWA